MALLNRGSEPLQITTDASTVGLRSAASYSVHDLWAGASETTAGVIAATVPPDSAVLYRVTPDQR